MFELDDVGVFEGLQDFCFLAQFGEVDAFFFFLDDFHGHALARGQVERLEHFAERALAQAAHHVVALLEGGLAAREHVGKAASSARSSVAPVHFA